MAVQGGGGNSGLDPSSAKPHSILHEMFEPTSPWADSENLEGAAEAKSRDASG